MLWKPSPQRAAQTGLARFMLAAGERAGRTFPSYWDLHAWSIAQPNDFWSFCLESARLPISGSTAEALHGAMPDTRWFESVTLNYARAILESPHWPSPEAAAIIAIDEAGRERTLDLLTLRRHVARAAAALRRDGIGAGDRVVAFVQNVPEAVVLLLACASLGAVFSSCSPDFGVDAAYARFHQIAPRLLVASDGYAYNGKPFDTRPVVRNLAARLPGSPKVVIVPSGATDGTLDVSWQQWDAWLAPEGTEVAFLDLPFDHPLYVLYSSGTTGLPKAIVHRGGGALLTHYKEHRLHSDIGPGDRVLYFTTCGWMMWNWLVSALAQGATIVLFEGSPAHPSLDALWRTVDRLRVTHFGTSARFIHGCKTADVSLSESLELASLRAVLSTGSPLSASGFEWVYQHVKRDVHLASISGGTDIVGCFMLGIPTEAVHAGQIQGPALGADIAAYDAEGRPLVGAPGELVCRTPLPSMPLGFWNDPDRQRYRDAYFATYPGVWRHGDLIEITPERGIVVFGRSDATLNPGGVRIGTAEIYRPLEAIPEIADALAVGKREGDDEVIWLFVVLQEGGVLDTALERRIAHTIRSHESPRHVPRRIVQVSQLPRTRSGKTMEIAVSRLVNGLPVPNREVVANPESLDEIAARLSSATPHLSG